MPSPPCPAIHLRLIRGSGTISLDSDQALLASSRHAITSCIITTKPISYIDLIFSPGSPPG